MKQINKNNERALSKIIVIWIWGFIYCSSIMQKKIENPENIIAINGMEIESMKGASWEMCTKLYQNVMIYFSF